MQFIFKYSQKQHDAGVLDVIHQKIRVNTDSSLDVLSFPRLDPVKRSRIHIPNEKIQQLNLSCAVVSGEKQHTTKFHTKHSKNSKTLE